MDGHEDKAMNTRVNLKPTNNFIQKQQHDIDRSASVLLKDNGKMRRDEETRRGSCPRVRKYANRDISFLRTWFLQWPL